MNAFCKLFIFLGFIFVTNVYAEQLDSSAPSNGALAQELAELVDLYTNGDREEQMKSINSRIRFSGITDVALFDIAEKNMLSVNPRSTERENTQYIAWMAQMLAFSGQDKYRASLNKLLSKGTSDNVKHHVTTSLEVLPKYQRWNAIISQNLDGVPKSGLAKARLINMLNGDDPELVRGAASIADHFYLADEEITDLVEKRLLVLYLKATPLSDDQYAEASAWLCKILGNTRKQKYVATLTQIRETSHIIAIRRWAKKALENFVVEPKQF